MKLLKRTVVALFVIIFTTGVYTVAQKPVNEINIAYEQYKLSNGLDVILHVDKSDPIVAVAISYHVGSNREVKGRTGFAHLFEHMMFQRSENVGEDQFFKLIQNAGGTLNGGTSFDGTVYYEIVPNNALEMALWMESDRMGYMINTVTQKAFTNQQNVVQNEKRQRVDNVPYGHTDWVIGKSLYPDGHPYNWQVIGEMEDLFNATVNDVKQFHAKYYVPGNATLVLAGDFDITEAKEFIKKYFGEIPAGNKVDDMKPMPVLVKETIKLYHEDNFARAPQMNMVWPSIENFTDDSYALDALAELLASGKKSPFYNVLVKDKKLTSRVSAYNNSQELAGEFTITITANSGVSLNDVHKAVFESFDKFEKDGISDTDMERIKAGLETQFYNSIGSVLSKAYRLAYYNEYAGNAGYTQTVLAKIRAVTKEDIMRVYVKYVKNKPYIVTSFVPKGQIQLMVEGSVKAAIVEENVSEAVSVNQNVTESEEEIIKTKTVLDRSVMPELKADPALLLPKVWTDKLKNGIKVYGIEHMELPLVQISMVIDGGQMLDNLQKIGVANLTAEMLMLGTKSKTAEELEEAIRLLGSTISVRCNGPEIEITANTLARNYHKTIALIEEILFEPRWDVQEFEIVKTKVINNLKQSKANPNYLAYYSFTKVLYGEQNLPAFDKNGTVESVTSITIDDVKNYYNQNFSPTVTKFHVAGAIKKDEALLALKNVTAKWKAKKVVIPTINPTPAINNATVYFVDVPGAKQSVIYIGYLAIQRTNPDFFAATVMNYKLGGSFSGVVNLILREEKGYTYGARTGFSEQLFLAPFSATASVRSTATTESVKIFKESMETYRNGISLADLEFTKNSLLRSNALRFETLGALLNMLSDISAYNLSPDFVIQEDLLIREMTLESHKALAQKYINPDKMIYLVVGDAATQLEPLKTLGLGDPIIIK